MVTGCAVIVPLSIGNNPSLRSPIRVLVAFVLALGLSWIPFVLDESSVQWIEPFGSWRFIFLAGNVCSVLLLIQMVASVIGDHRIRRSWLLSTWLGTSDANGCERSEKAAFRKIRALLDNALKLHKRSESREEIMMNFARWGERVEDCGGLCWTWQSTLSGALFDREGIWIMSRVFFIQAAQVACLVFTIHSIFCFIIRAVDGVHELHDTVHSGSQLWMRDVVPTPEHVRTALYSALGISIVDMIAIILVYLPR